MLNVRCVGWCDKPTANSPLREISIACDMILSLLFWSKSFTSWFSLTKLIYQKSLFVCFFGSLCQPHVTKNNQCSFKYSDTPLKSLSWWVLNTIINTKIIKGNAPPAPFKILQMQDRSVMFSSLKPILLFCHREKSEARESAARRDKQLPGHWWRDTWSWSGRGKTRGPQCHESNTGRGWFITLNKLYLSRVQCLN